MASLILAGESIYTLPYYLRRDYAKVMVRSFELSQTDLGTLSSMFGVLALLCYLPGGWLADRLSPRHLLSFSLASTALGSLVLLADPSFPALVALFGFWGVTTILTFWGALIKATREWGGAREQGRAFGLLDGGRGLVGAALASLALAAFASASSSSRGLEAVIQTYAATAGVAAVAVWFSLRDHAAANVPGPPVPEQPGPAVPISMGDVLRNPIVFLHAIVIFCAYAAYWGTFDLSSYAVDAYGYGDVAGASVSAVGLWLRFPAAVGAGLIADRIGTSKTVIAAFAITMVALAGFALIPPSPDRPWVLWGSTAVLCVGTYALRGVYFALLAEAQLPRHVTGVAVGAVSLVGFTPDIIIPPIAGGLVDAFAGATGHRIYFGLLTVVAALGLGATLAFRVRVCRDFEAETVPDDGSQLRAKLTGRQGAT